MNFTNILLFELSSRSWMKIGIGAIFLVIYLIRQFRNNSVISKANSLEVNSESDFQKLANDLDFPIKTIKQKHNDSLNILNQIDYEIELEYIKINRFVKIGKNRFLAFTIAEQESDNSRFNYKPNFKIINYLLEFEKESNSIKYKSHSYQDVDEGGLMNDFCMKFSEYIDNFEF